MRYGLAFLCLLPFTFRPAYLTTLRRLTRQDWLRLISLGLIFYAVTQGAQFLGLAYLPANTVNLLLNFTPAVVTLLGIVLLAEVPTLLQWGGVGLSLAGAVIYFYPAALPSDQVFGLIVVLVGVLANAGSAVLGRHVNRAGHLSPLFVTLVSMSIGSVALLVAGISLQGLPTLSLANWAIIAWLAVVNTAFAFTLWNLTLRTLSAMESSLINGVMLLQIPALAWLFLGEAITWREGLGLALAGVGIVLVQLYGRQKSPNS
ncbi:MAG: EamA family transporter [Chloroflexi bacterium]|nr:EamA family transporter [Chloroflexota bacterium]